MLISAIIYTAQSGKKGIDGIAFVEATQASAAPALDPDDMNEQLIRMICYVTGVE